MNKHFLEILDKSRAIHEKKAADYTTDSNADPHENFTRASEIASWFPNEYKSHTVLIGTKLARLGALLSSERTPNNESLDDTFLDLLTYVGLMYSFYKDSQIKDTFVFKTGYEEFRENPIGEPEYIRGLGAELPQKIDSYQSDQCTHPYLNLNRKCLMCSDSVSWNCIHKAYQLDEAHDCYRFISAERK